LATALARSLRQSWLANDLGVLAPYGLAGRARGTDCDLDLPQSATTVSATADRQFGPIGTATVRIAAVWFPAIRLSPVPGTLGITHLRIAGTIRHRKWRE
jgi:hypothetical protein